MRSAHIAAFAVSLLFCTSSAGAESLTPEPGGNSYHYVSHYSVEIAAPVADVWIQLTDLDSWMYEFDLAPESGVAGQEGEVLRLYEDQDFFIQTTKVIPNELLVFANLPSSMHGEYSTGAAVITLNESNGITTVNLTMSRRYSWEGTEPNPNITMRESAEFQERARAMWQDRFLDRLKTLVETE